MGSTFPTMIQSDPDAPTSQEVPISFLLLIQQLLILEISTIIIGALLDMENGLIMMIPNLNRMERNLDVEDERLYTGTYY